MPGAGQSSEINETSPLVMSSAKLDEDDGRQASASASAAATTAGAESIARARQNEMAEQESKSTWYLILLTLSIGGLQVVWSVELSNGSPFLLSLGMSKALLAIVWVAGPLTGTLVQPYIGILSDNCRLPWGKRKPFMIGGGLATIICLMFLAWVREIVSGILGIFGADAQSKGVIVTTQVLATIMMFCLDFAINTGIVQAGIRAFIVDCAPAHQQEPANAWASRLVGAGNIFGYILGYMDLPKAFPIFGNTQFKVLCWIASLSLGVTLLISCLTIKERDPRLEGPPPPGGLGLISFFRGVWKSIRNLPPQIRKVCEVQLAAWVAWFPFLYYSTTYVGQLYVNPIFEKNRDLTDDEINKAWEDATRIGSFALLVNAVVCFTANIVLPLMVVPSYKRTRVSTGGVEFSPVAQEIDAAEAEIRRSISEIRGHIPSEPLLSHEQRSVVSDDADDSEDDDTKRKRLDLLKKLRIPGLTLRRTWLFSLALLSACMFSTFFISTSQAATVIIGIVGISWAVTLWAPFALISAEVAQRDAERRLARLQAELEALSHHGMSPENAASAMNQEDEDEDEDEDEQDLEAAAAIIPKTSHDDSPTDQAGIVLGLHNVAVSFPQIISTIVSSLIFKALQKPRGEPWDDSVGWVMRFGGCAALIAALLAKRLEEKRAGSR